MSDTLPSSVAPSLRERQLATVRFVLLNQLLGSQLNGGEPRVPTPEGLDSTAEDIVDELAALAQPTAAPTDWRPISEAPNAGRVILVSDGKGVWLDCILEGAWWENNAPTGYTHFMPLPAPPATQEEGR